MLGGAPLGGEGDPTLTLYSVFCAPNEQFGNAPPTHLDKHVESEMRLADDQEGSPQAHKEGTGSRQTHRHHKQRQTKLPHTHGTTKTTRLTDDRYGILHGE